MRDADADMAALLRGMQPRPEPPADVRERVHEAVAREWRQHKRRRWRIPASLAAALLVAVTAGFVVTLPDGSVTAQLTDTRALWVDGRLHRQGGHELMLQAGTLLQADADTRLLTGDAEIRLKGGTRLVWQRSGAVELQQGALYVQTDGVGRLEVHTPLGVVSDIGTTFLVTLHEGVMEVALREGAASIETRHGSYVARSEGYRGDVVSVDASRISHRSEPASAGRWQWIHTLHPGYRERELVPLLEAIAADLGVRLEFASDGDRAAALASRLDGDLSGLEPSRALEVALASAGFASVTEPDGRLVVNFPSELD